jgi:hypothetical protein
MSDDSDGFRATALLSEEMVLYGAMSSKFKWYAVGALFLLATMTQVNLSIEGN